MSTCGLNEHRNTNHTENNLRKCKCLWNGRTEHTGRRMECLAFFFGGGGGGGQVTERVYACFSGRKENHYCERGNVIPN